MVSKDEGLSILKGPSRGPRPLWLATRASCGAWGAFDHAGQCGSMWVHVGSQHHEDPCESSGSMDSLVFFGRDSSVPSYFLCGFTPSMPSPSGRFRIQGMMQLPSLPHPSPTPPASPSPPLPCLALPCPASPSPCSPCPVLFLPPQVHFPNPPPHFLPFLLSFQFPIRSPWPKSLQWSLCQVCGEPKVGRGASTIRHDADVFPVALGWRSLPTVAEIDAFFALVCVKASAFRACRSGAQVTLFEKEGSCGGHTLTDDSPGFPIDLGFQV